MKLDPGIHIVMHSVLFLKPGVTAEDAGRCRVPSAMGAGKSLKPINRHPLDPRVRVKHSDPPLKAAPRQSAATHRQTVPINQIH